MTRSDPPGHVRASFGGLRVVSEAGPGLRHNIIYDAPWGVDWCTCLRVYVVYANHARSPYT